MWRFLRKLLAFPRRSGARGRARAPVVRLGTELTIEFGAPRNPFTCPCCGESSHSLVRYVCKAGVAHAIYYAGYNDRHAERVVLVALSIGDWSDEAVPTQRVTFALELRSGATEYEVEILDAVRSPWNHVTLIGSTLNRAEALEHPLLHEVYRIADKILADDRTVSSRDLPVPHRHGRPSRQYDDAASAVTLCRWLSLLLSARSRATGAIRRRTGWCWIVSPGTARPGGSATRRLWHRGARA